MLPSKILNKFDFGIFPQRLCRVESFQINFRKKNNNSQKIVTRLKIVRKKTLKIK